MLVSYIIFVYLSYGCYKPVDGRLSVRPRDTLVQRGSRAVLSCSVASSPNPPVAAKWYHERVGAAGTFPTPIYTDPPASIQSNASRYVDQTNVGQYDLVVLSAKPQEAGKYYCRHDVKGEMGRDVEATAHLVVINGIRCESNETSTVSGGGDGRGSDRVEVITGEDWSLLCSAEYFGEQDVISLLWMSTNGGTKGSKTVASSTTAEVRSDQLANPNIVKSQLNIKTPQNHDSSALSTAERYSCTALLKSRVDEVGLGCLCPEIHFVLPVRNCRILNDTFAFYRRGETLECRAEGNPDVQYEWREEHSGAISVGAVLTLTDSGTLDFVCTASNVIRNVRYSDTAKVRVIVGGGSDEDFKKYVVSGGAAVGGLLVVVATLALAVLYCNRKSSKEQVNQDDSPAITSSADVQTADTEATEQEAVFYDDATDGLTSGSYEKLESVQYQETAPKTPTVRALYRRLSSQLSSPTQTLPDNPTTEGGSVEEISLQSTFDGSPPELCLSFLPASRSDCPAYLEIVLTDEKGNTSGFQSC